MSQQTVRITFEFRTTTRPGEEVIVVGEAEELGAWNPTKGVLMKTDEERYPIWSTMIPLKANSSSTYKYVFWNKIDYTWEKVPGNRLLEVEDYNMIIKDDADSLVSRQIQCQFDAGLQLAKSLEKPSIYVDDAVKFNPNSSTIIVSMNLPIRVERNPSYEIDNPNSEKWLFEVDDKGLWLPVLYEIANRENINFVWIGWPHIFIENESEQEELANILKTRYKCEPLFVPEDTMILHTQFCNGILYPLFNNIIGTAQQNNPQYSEELWEAYRKVNSFAADKIMKIYKDELIWVHDYQLLLTPSFVSRRTRDILNIGIFLHHPFPSCEIYRVLPHREAILHAMLCCDLIGFHLFEYARHFLGSCKRILGIDHQFSPGGYLMLDYYGRHIMIRIGHLGVEPHIIDEVCKTDDYSNTVKELKALYGNKKVLLGIDPLHRLSGISLKLKALKLSMQNLHQYRQKVVFVQLLAQAKNSSDDEKNEVLAEIMQLRDEINSEVGAEVVQFVEGDISRVIRYAYMSIASGVINSSYREGLFLIPFEVIAINKEKPVEIIISEFAGVSRALSSLKKVNPFDIVQLEGEIHYLITSPTSNHNSMKRKRDLDYIHNNTTQKWAYNFLSDLIKAKKDTKHFQYVTHGLGDRLKLIALKKKFSLLKAEYLLKSYKETKNRAFFFDNEGTLSNLFKQTEIDKSIGPSEKIINCLTDLCKDERNTVYVVTGRSRKVVENWFGTVPSLGMAAEYGAVMKWNYTNNWQSIITEEKPWMETAIQIVSAYVVRTEGSTIEIKDCSVVFSYRDTDPDIGTWQAKELISHLEILLKPFTNDCEISAGLGYVEIKPIGTTKGTAVFRVLQDLKERKGPPDFVLTIGDDIADEEMFKVLKALKREGSPLVANKRNLRAFTCTVGRKPSNADFYVNDASEVVHIIEHLRGWSNVCKKNFSYGDLRQLSQRHSYHSLHQLEISKSPHIGIDTYAEESEEEEPLSPMKIWKA